MSAVGVTQAKGEVAEVRTLLRDARMERDVGFRRQALRQVVALMTAGIDVSELFANMIVACATTDLVSKKLIYLFLTAYARKNAELALLSINTFVKECAEGSPIVRGLALRSFAALRVPELLDYLLPILTKALADESAYVRRIAVLCTLRVYSASPAAYARSKFFDLTTALLRDSDTQVCLNALEVLLELGSATMTPPDATHETAMRFAVTRPILYQLLNRMPRLDAAQRVQVVRLLPRYTPADEEEMYDLLNLLEEWVQTSHVGLLLACCRAFLKLTENYPAVQNQVVERLCDPLLSRMAAAEADCPELAYTLLRHIDLLVRRAPGLFRTHYPYFYCGYDEQPTYLQMAKMDLLVRVADEASATAILGELAVYAEGRREATARRAVDCIGRIAVRLPAVGPVVLQHLLRLLNDGDDVVRGAALVAMQRHYLRVCRDATHLRPFFDILGRLHAEANTWKDEASRTALLWVLGEFGEHVPDAPYMMEVLCEQLQAEGAAFRLQALSSVTILFFKRPPEMQGLLGTVLRQLAEDFGNADVLDRALLYYRLLRASPAEAASVIGATDRPVAASPPAVVDATEASLLDRLFDEFDTLSVVYGVPSDGLAERTGTHSDAESSVGELLSDTESSDGETDEGVRAGGVAAAASQNARATNTVDLLWSESSSREADAPVAMSAPAVAMRRELDADAELSPQAYEKLWATPAVTTRTLKLPLAMHGGDVAEVLEEALAARHIFTLALGEQPGGGVRMFIYAQACGATGPVLAELSVADGTASATIKALDDCIDDFEKQLREALLSIL